MISAMTGNQPLTYQFSGKEFSPRERLGVLSFLMRFDVYIANNWQVNIDCEI